MKLSNSIIGRLVRKNEWPNEGALKILFVGIDWVVGVEFPENKEVVFRFDPKDDEWIMLESEDDEE